MIAQPERFACEACVVRQQFDELWPENREAWDVYTQISSRTVVDFHLAPLIIDAAAADLTPAETLALIRRLDLIRDTLDPPTAHHHG